MENSTGKALISGKNAEKRRSEAIKRELLVLTHDFLIEEGLFEAADALQEHIQPLLSQYKVADNIDLPLIATEFLAYYRLRFHKDPIIIKKCETNEQQKPIKKSSASRSNRHRRAGKDGEATSAAASEDKNNEFNDKNSKLCLARSLKVPRPMSDDDKELFSIIARDVIVQTSAYHDVNENNKFGIKLKDVIGLNDAKEALEDAFLLPLQHPEIYKAQLASQVNGVLLAGPPGTGKTMIAKALATESQDTAIFFNIHSSSLASKWRGDSEKLVRILFEMAYHNAPSIIFIDEIEAILSERGCQGEHEASKRAKAEFLVHLDGLRNNQQQCGPVLFLASTNLLWTLDPAIIRRFQRVINVGLPNSKERLDIFLQCLRGQDISGLDLKTLAHSDLTGEFSGSDIQRGCCNAINKVLRRKVAAKSASSATGNNRGGNSTKLTMKDMLECLNLVKSTLNSSSTSRPSKM